MRTRVDQELSESGLTWLTFSLLAVTAAVEGLPQQALVTRTRVDRNRTSALLDDLEYEGLVSRARSLADRRRILVTATGEGRAMLAEALPAVERAELATMRGLDARERSQLHALLERIVRSAPIG